MPDYTAPHAVSHEPVGGRLLARHALRCRAAAWTWAWACAHALRNGTNKESRRAQARPPPMPNTICCNTVTHPAGRPRGILGQDAGPAAIAGVLISRIGFRLASSGAWIGEGVARCGRDDLQACPPAPHLAIFTCVHESTALYSSSVSTYRGACVFLAEGGRLRRPTSTVGAETTSATSERCLGL